jgi:ribose transport system permease protein
MCIIGILAIGQGFVVISGGILDLSITVSMLITSFMTVVFYDLGWNTPLLIIVSLLCAGVFGLFNSILVVWLRINPLIVTLATGFAGGGLLLIVFDRGLVDPKSSIADFGTSYLFGLPTAWWPMALLTIGAHFFFKYSRVGRHFLAVGGNPLSSKAMGISLKRTRVATFVGSSIFGGIAGIVFAGFTPEIRPNAGEFYTLPVIAAVVLAGFSLAGGRGSFLALFISVGFLSTIPTALVFFGLQSIWQTFIQGFILIIAVSIDAYRIVKVRGR